MNLVRRLGLRRSLDGLSFFRRRPSNGHRSADPVPSSPAAAAAKDTRWAMLNSAMCRMDGSVAVDANTMAESHTTDGRHLRVALGLMAPPGSSFRYYDCEDSGMAYHNIIAAHRDSVLFRIDPREGASSYFIYSAGVGRRLPSLSRLPAGVDGGGRVLSLFEEDTGILRHGEKELLVARLVANTNHAELRVLRLGSAEWELKTGVPIVAAAGDGSGQWQVTETDKVVAVGDRFLCWVHYSDGVLICDMVEECPKLRHVPPPVVPPWWKDYYEEGNRPPIEYSRSTCGTGDGTLRFVSIDLRCCCGGFGMSTCEHSSSAFMVTTWSLDLTINMAMAWVKDTVLHCEELWALPGYEGLPCVHPECPVMSLHNPDVVYLMVMEDKFASFEERKVWIIEVDTRRKVLLSVVPCTTYAQKNYTHVPVEFGIRNFS